MSFHSYLEEKKELQSCLHKFIDHNGIDEEIFQDLIKVINKQQIREIKLALRSLLHLISIISINYHRTPDFFTKIDKILSDLSNEIRDNFTNTEIFQIFKQSKRVLLFLIQNELLTIDQTIANTLLKPKYCKLKYPHYFYPEIKSFITDSKLQQEIEKEVNKCSNNFEENRKTGENHTKICYLIRNDLIDDFRSHVNQTQTKTFSNIEVSIFETNPLLYKSRATLLDYSAFNGSIQIFNFLRENNRMSSDTWLFAIHGNNLEIIQSIENHQIRPKDPSFATLLRESFKCQHHEITTYIKDNLLKIKDDKDNRFLLECTKFYDYYSFPQNLNDKIVFYNLCIADNASFVSGLLSLLKIDFKINEQVSNIILIINFVLIEFFFISNEISIQLFQYYFNFECFNRIFELILNKIFF